MILPFAMFLLAVSALVCDLRAESLGAQVAFSFWVVFFVVRTAQTSTDESIEGRRELREKAIRAQQDKVNPT